LTADEKVLVVARADNCFGVSRDGGWHFDLKNRTLLEEGQPGWWPSQDIRSTIPYGNGNFAEVQVTGSAGETSTGWLLGTGFLPALTMDEGDTFRSIINGFAEVCAYQPVSLNTAHKQGLSPFAVTGGVMDLSMFAWSSSTSALKGSYDYTLFNHQPLVNGKPTWWVTDYCHTTVAVKNGDLVAFCNHQGWGCGQLLRSTDKGKTWTLTDAVNISGIEHCVPFVDVAQNQENLDDIVITGGFGWMPPPGDNNATTWVGGLRRSTDGGKTFLMCSDTKAVQGFVGS
jgi:hypothetical protein